MPFTTQKFTALVGNEYKDKDSTFYYLHNEVGKKIPIVLREDMFLIWRPPRTDDYDFGSSYQVINLQQNEGRTSLTIQKTIPIRYE